MAALASIATLVAAGASTVGAVRQAGSQREMQRAQAQAAQQQEQVRQRELVAQREQDRAERSLALSRTIASTRARLAAGGVAPDDGSAASLTTGLREAAAEADGLTDEAFRARLARGRTSLLAPDGTVNAFLQAGRTLGQATRSLLG
jgi:small-conductance mechanosensitive channel